jgi:hypothetical protein
MFAKYQTSEFRQKNTAATCQRPAAFYLGAISLAPSDPAKRSGRTTRKYIMRAFGSPVFLHSEIEGAETLKNSAALVVPPNSSIRVLSLCFSFCLAMPHFRHA